MRERRKLPWLSPGPAGGRGGRRMAVGLGVAALLGSGPLPVSGSAAEMTPAPPPACPAAGDAEMIAILRPIRDRHDVPALAAAIVTSDGLQRMAVVGVRKRGAAAAATLADKWHLGSNTKAMTATLAAALVEKGALRWESTVGGLFPELAEALPPRAREVSLLHLLSHRAGVPENLDLAAYGGSAVRELRRRAVRGELAAAAGPGAGYRYSNLGYIVAGAMMERAMDASWEALMREHMFGPLGMTGAGFGGVGAPGSIDHPWGHHDDGRPVAAAGPEIDNPPVMGPAGRVHGTLTDWARFIADQLRGARGQPALLPGDAYARLHTPPFGGDYALGWMALTRDWGGGRVLTHAGSNTMNYSNVWIAPPIDAAILVCVNQGGDAAFQATDAAVGALVALHRARSGAPAKGQ